MIFTLTNTSVKDIYRLPIGIRNLRWTDTALYINEKPIYFRGFGRHEDSAIRGRGLDLPTVIRDHELLKWVGANSYRTSHYPYSEEVLDVADRYDEVLFYYFHIFSIIENYRNKITVHLTRN